MNQRQSEGAFAVLILAALFVALVLLAGCATPTTLEHAGLTSVEVTTPDGARYDIKLGKEYASFHLELSWTPEGKPVVTADAEGVSAFQGQAIAASAYVATVNALVELGITITPELRQALMGGLGL